MCPKIQVEKTCVSLKPFSRLDNFIDHVRAWGFCGRGMSTPQENQLSRTFRWIKYTPYRIVLTELQPLENT